MINNKSFFFNKINVFSTNFIKNILYIYIFNTIINIAIIKNKFHYQHHPLTNLHIPLYIQSSKRISFSVPLFLKALDIYQVMMILYLVHQLANLKIYPPIEYRMEGNLLHN
jgi:hypothetical protein